MHKLVVDWSSPLACPNLLLPMTGCGWLLQVLRAKLEDVRRENRERHVHPPQHAVRHLVVEGGALQPVALDPALPRTDLMASCARSARGCESAASVSPMQKAQVGSGEWRRGWGWRGSWLFHVGRLGRVVILWMCSLVSSCGVLTRTRVCLGPVSRIASMVKKKAGAITLGIGDGANDVGHDSCGTHWRGHQRP